MVDGLVSIIIPCYNGEKYIKNLFLSIAEQSYKNIEVILINDVSTDGTDECVNKFKHILEYKNIILKYEVLAEKGYASGAVNRGLKIMSGEYFMLLDCDDYIYPDNVLKKIEFLNKNKNYAWVMTMARVVNGLDHSDVKRVYTRIKPLTPKKFFKDLIWGRNVFYTPGIYMYRTSEFLKINPDREIYISKGGQNYQMLLPMAYEYKIGYIKKVLFDWYTYPNSHSHKIDSYENHMDIINGYNDNICSTINMMNTPDKFKLLKIAANKHNYSCLVLAFQHNKLDEYDRLYRDLKSNNRLTVDLILLNLRVKNKIAKALADLKEKLKVTVLQIIKRNNND